MAEVESPTTAPVGIFDSGFGGLTVARAVLDQLPHEAVLYVGDTKNAPYGPKPLADVRSMSLACLDYLVDQGVKMLVIACNSASAAVLHDARERYDVPVIEVIRPAARRACAVTRSGRVGVMCTAMTAQSGAYEDAFSVNPTISVTTQACPRLVHFVEAGITSGPKLMAAAREYLEPLAAAQVDTIVLGCTHYPLLTGPLSYVMDQLSPDRAVTFVSSAEETALAVYRKLEESGLAASSDGPEPEHLFLTTGDTEQFATLARRFMSIDGVGEAESTLA